MMAPPIPPVGAKPAKRFVKPPTKAERKKRRKGLQMRIGADGSYDIRHATDLVGESVTLADVATLRDAAPVWIQVAKVGQFAGHPAGAFRLDEKVFGEIVRNFQTTSNRRVPIDFEHASESDATAGSIPTDGAPAQGWIVDLDNRGAAGLWALVEWGTKAREYIQAGQYRYISPAVRFGSKDRVTGQAIGARLTSAGLTNQPFLDGMQALAARDGLLNRPAMRASDFMPAMRAALRLPELATYAECADQIGRLRGMCEMAESGGGDPMGIHEGVDLGGYIGGLRGLMAMPSHSTLHELLEAVESMIEAAMERHEVEHHSGEHEDDDDAEEAVDATMSAVADPTKEATMADATNITSKDTEALAEASRLLKDANDARIKAEAKAEADAAQSALVLKDMQAQLIALKANEDKRAEDDAKRLAAEQEARVTETIAVYSDKKGISEADRPNLLITLKAAPAAFDALYPPVPAAQRHLMRNLSGQKTVTVGGGNTVQMGGRRADVPGHIESAPAPSQSTPEGIARGRVVKALSGGASLEQAILMSSRAPTNAAS